MGGFMKFGNPNEAPVSGANLGTRGRMPDASQGALNIGPASISQGYHTDPLGAKTPADMLAKGGNPSSYASGLGTLTNSNGSASAGPSVDPATGGAGTGANWGKFAPTGAQVAQNPGQFAGTSFDPTRNLMSEAQGTPGGANSMGMRGAGMVNGVAGYTQGNGPLDRSRFTPQGGAGQAWYNQVFGRANPNNISYLQFMDQLGQRALNSVGGYQAGNMAPDAWAQDGGITAQINYLNSDEGQKWLQQLTADPNAQQQQQQQQQQQTQTTTGTGTGTTTTGAPPPPPPDPAKAKQQESAQASQIVNYLTQNGIQPRDIPIGIRLAALGVQGQNPLVGIGGQNPIMQLLMSGGANNPLLALLQQGQK